MVASWAAMEQISRREQANLSRFYLTRFGAPKQSFGA
jgi:hypothetical protein